MRTLTKRRERVLGVIFALWLSACSVDQILGSNTLPPDVSDPAVTKTADGALATYRGAVVSFERAFGGSGRGNLLTSAILPMALLTDELEDGAIGRVGVSDAQMSVDARSLPETGVGTGDFGTYGSLQRARGQIQEALGALAAYAPHAPAALRGRLFAFEGYTEVFLADLFCSGIPLSTLDFAGDFTYQPGSTTQEVYQRAIAHFDSALTLAADSTDVMNLARVGKGRALLALGENAAAAQAVTDAPDAFRYAIRYSQNPPSAVNFAVLLPGGSDVSQVDNAGAMMTDREGGNGLPYLSSRDPRVPSVFVGTNLFGVAHYVPAKYSSAGDSPIVLADGVEARLITSEAQLQAGDATWLATLNALRTDGTYDTQPDPNDATKTDTLWHAGTGGVAGLAPLPDPGTLAARVDLIFQERGYWLFLTGHRQGDLRRLVREYNRSPAQVYPTGSYLGLNGRYGGDVTVPIPGTEQLYNPLFHGCINRGA